MYRSILLSAAAIALVAGTISAEAGCVPSLSHKGASVKMPQFLLQSPLHSGSNLKASAAIVGLWQVSYTVEGNPFADAYIQWHSDGTEWENINLPVSDGNICLGAWKAVDGRHVYRYHVGWLYTNDNLSGYFTETETDKVSRDGTSYAGTNEQKIYDLNGNLQADVTGTSSATKISP
jgi:hypothetical protein